MNETEENATATAPVTGTENAHAAVVPSPETAAPAPAASPYEALCVPPDAEVPPEALDEVKAMAQKLNLSAEQAQELLDFEVGGMRETQEILARQRDLNAEEWARETRAFYGAQTEAALSLAVRAADAFGGPELRALLERTGLGNHLAIVRTFYEIGKSISEDVLPGGKPAAPQDKTFAEALYGNHH